MNDVALTEKSRAICVLGMHRSGTSLVAGMLEALGAYIGERNEMIAPSEVNPKGFWERLDILSFHEELLAALARRWDTAEPLSEGWSEIDSVRLYEGRLTKFIRERFSEHALWAWKDPRTCLLLPLWEKVLVGLKVNARYVCVFRNPLEVAQSLLRRDGFSLQKSLGIWLNYNVSLLSSVPAERSLFLLYGDLLEKQAQEIQRLAKFTGAADRGVSYQNVEKLPDPDLYHNRAFGIEQDLSSLPDTVARFYHKITMVCRGELSAHELQKDAKRVLSELRDYSALLIGESDVEVRRQRAAEVVALTELVVRKDKVISESEKLVRLKDEHLEFAAKLIEELKQQIATHRDAAPLPQGESRARNYECRAGSDFQNRIWSEFSNHAEAIERLSCPDQGERIREVTAALRQMVDNHEDLGRLRRDLSEVKEEIVRQRADIRWLIDHLNQTMLGRLVRLLKR